MAAVVVTAGVVDAVRGAVVTAPSEILELSIQVLSQPALHRLGARARARARAGAVALILDGEHIVGMGVAAG